MNTNDTDNTNSKKYGLIYEDLSFRINGVLFSTHNELGPYAREKHTEMLPQEFLQKRAFLLKEKCGSATPLILLTVLSIKK